MYEITGKARFKNLLDNWRQGIKDAPYTPNGMIHIAQWGSARHATNVAFLFALLGRFDNQACFQPTYKCVGNVWVHLEPFTYKCVSRVGGLKSFKVRRLEFCQVST